MRRLLFRSLLVVTLLVLGIVVAVALRAEPPLPPPDPATVIHLPDGSARPLSEVLDLARESRLPAAPKPLVTVDAGPIEDDEPRSAPSELTPEQAEAQARRQAANVERVEAELLAMQGTVFELAERARGDGRLEESVALFLSVPEDDRWYPDARRQLAWHVLADGLQQPRRGVTYAHDALVADPFNGNSWQDMARVYGATLGIGVD